MIAAWMEETAAAKAKWNDENLVRAGLRVFETLSRSVNARIPSGDRNTVP
jgi:hypothetical protein